MLLRHAIAALLLASALLLVAATMSGRTAAAEATAGAVRVGEYDGGLPELGGDEPFSPFAFAVVGPIRGSHAALGRALSLVSDVDGLRSVILLGDVLGDGDPLRIAVTIRSSGTPLVAVAGNEDVRQLAQFQQYVCAPDWSFRDRDCLFTSWGPGSQGNAERVPADDVAARFLFTTAPEAAPELGWAAAFSAESESDEVSVEIVRVGADASVQREMLSVSAAPSLRSTFTTLSVGVLYPASRSSGGLVTLLLAAAAMVFAALRLARISRPPA